MQEVGHQHKALKIAQSDVATEVAREQDVKSKFGSAVAEKYREVVQHLQVLEENQKLANNKEKERRSQITKSLGVDKRGLNNPAEKEGFTTLERSRGGYHSSYSLLDSGSSVRRDGMDKSRGGARSPTTERDNPFSIRNAKPSNSTSALLGSRGERGRDRGVLEKGENKETSSFEVDGNRIANDPGDNRIARDKAFASFTSSTSESAEELVRRENYAYDFRSIALVQNELANRLADVKLLEAHTLDNTRDQVLPLSLSSLPLSPLLSSPFPPPSPPLPSPSPTSYLVGA